MVAKDDASCFEAPPVVALVVGYFLTTGIVVSYIPQIWMIIARRSSEGVSVLTMWLSFVCACLTFVNAFMLDWDGIQCCRYLTVGQIFQQLLPLEQLFVGPFCLFFLFICIVYYFDMTPTNNVSTVRKRVDRLVARVMLVLNFVLLAALGASTFFFIEYVGPEKDSYTGYAYSLGLISSVVIGFVWLPQIYVTYKNKDTGALSIAMLLIQAPGNILVVCFQAILAGNNWTTWLPYVITAVEQLTLTAMWVWYKCIKPKRSAKIVAEDTESDIARMNGAAAMSPYLQLPTDEGVPELNGYHSDDNMRLSPTTTRIN